MRRRVLGAAVSVSLLAACAPATSAASRATQTAQARAFATHSGVLAASGDVRAYCRLVGQVHNGKGRSYTIAPVSYSACRQALFTGLGRFKSGEFARMGVALEHERRHLNVRTVAAGDIEVTAIDGADHVRVGLDVAFYRQRAFLISIEDSAPGFFTGTVF